MRFALLVAVLALFGCATPPEPPATQPVDPTVVHDFLVVPRSPDVAMYPAEREHVWVPVPSDRVWVTVKVVNYPAPRLAPSRPVVVSPPAPSTAVRAAAPSKSPELYTAEVLFAFDRHTLDAQGKLALDLLVQRVGASMPASQVVVEGFTDSVGSDSYNLKLSQRRASSVRDYLVSKGASQALVAISGKGEASPADTNATEGGRSRNRRSTVYVTPD